MKRIRNVPPDYQEGFAELVYQDIGEGLDFLLPVLWKVYRAGFKSVEIAHSLTPGKVFLRNKDYAGEYDMYGAPFRGSHVALDPVIANSLDVESNVGDSQNLFAWAKWFQKWADKYTKAAKQKEKE